MKWNIILLICLVLNLVIYLVKILKLRVVRLIRLYDPLTNDMTEIALKPCPFCGKSREELIEQELSDGTKVYATICAESDGGCGSGTGFYTTQLDAILAWNTRGELDD